MNTIHLPENCKITPQINGENNLIDISPGPLANITINIRGSNNSIVIEEGCYFKNLYIGIFAANNCKVLIRKKTTMAGAVGINMHESSHISVGEDCMFSTGIMLTVSDMHPIYDKASGERLNQAKPVIVGNHVWIGKNCSLLKGTDIGDGSILGMGSIVNKAIPADCIAAGAPAKVIRKNIRWDRNFARDPI